MSPKLTTEQIGYRHRVHRAAREMREAAALLMKVDYQQIDYCLSGEVDDALRKLESVRVLAQKCARKKSP